MIRFVLYKSYSITPCEHVNRCKLVKYCKGRMLRGPRVCTQVWAYFFLNCNFFQRYEIISTLLGDYFVAETPAGVARALL